MSEYIKTIAKQIKLLVLDVDGVLTDGKITYTSSGDELKSFHVHDGLGLKRLMKSGVEVAIITNRSSDIVTRRMQELGIEHVYQGAKDNKLGIFKNLLAELKLEPSQVAYMGDDLPDIPVMEQVALPVTVANGVAAVKAIARYQTTLQGGQGAVRELCDLLIADIDFP